MVFKPKTLYSLNKLNPDAIVYMDAEQRAICLKREDFASEEEFLAWKSWSDENFHDEEKGDHRYANHTRSLSDLISVSGPESAAVRKEEQAEQARRIALIREVLTEKQFRRLWLYCVDGKTEQEIAEMEAVGQRRISTSIQAALEKIKKIFPDG